MAHMQIHECSCTYKHDSIHVKPDFSLLGNVIFKVSSGLHCLKDAHGVSTEIDQADKYIMVLRYLLGLILDARA